MTWSAEILRKFAFIIRISNTITDFTNYINPFWLPFIQRERFHDRDMHSQISMNSGTVNANKNSGRDIYKMGSSDGNIP